MLLSGGRGVSSGGAPENFGGGAAAFGPQCFEEVDRLDRAVAGPLLRERDDPPYARRDQNAFPEPFVAAAERSPNLGVRVGCSMPSAASASASPHRALQAMRPADAPHRRSIGCDCGILALLRGARVSPPD